MEGRVAIVTGAAHGIGRVYAHRLANEGAKVVIADLDTAGAVEVAEQGVAAALVGHADRVPPDFLFGIRPHLGA